ncbi:MAG: 2-aminoadipate transaminase [Acidimicrobiaceae bacterium]|jgi:DNA-binding transcriptional MocR family regulator
MSTIDAARFTPGGITPPGTVNLALGYPDETVFPHELLDLAVLGRPDVRSKALSYGPPSGNQALTDALFATVLRDEQRVGSTLITNGSMEAIDLVLRARARHGNILLSEDPTFPGLVDTARIAGLDVVAVPTDHEGVDPDALIERVHTVRLGGHSIAAIYLMPSASNPTGSRLTLERRQQIAAAAAHLDVLVIEDDAYRAINFTADEPPPTLHALNPANVLHLRSLSKVLSPGFRLALAIGPADVIDEMTQLKPVGGTTPFSSELIADLLSTLDYDKHLARLTDLYAHRCAVALDAVHHHLPDAHVTPPAGGFFLWLKLPPRINPASLYRRAAEAGVAYLPGTLFTIEPSDESFIRISFSFEPPDRISTGIAALAEAATHT